MVCHDCNWHQKSMKGILEVGSSGQCPPGGRPTIRQPSFTFSWQQWSLLNRFRTSQWHCGACRKTWRLTDWSVPLWGDPTNVPHRRILPSYLLPSWTVVCPSFTLLIMLLLPGWPTMGLNRICKKKKNWLKASSLRPFTLVTAQHSEPYSKTGRTQASMMLRLVTSRSACPYSPWITCNSTAPKYMWASLDWGMCNREGKQNPQPS